MNLLTYLPNRILRFYVSANRKRTQSFGTWQPCSYDCYEDGGCANCSVWVEKWDEDYGYYEEWLSKEAAAEYKRDEELGWDSAPVEEFFYNLEVTQPEPPCDCAVCTNDLLAAGNKCENAPQPSTGGCSHCGTNMVEFCQCPVPDANEFPF